MKPSIGQIVTYTLTERDVQQINRRRTTGDSIRDRINDSTWPIGAQAHIGSPVIAGEKFPMVITKVHAKPMTAVIGQVLLDGNDTLWVTALEGELSGDWSWPTRD